MGGIAVALTFLLKQQSDLSVRSNQDSAVSMAKSEITTMLTNPMHCNANLATAPQSATPTTRLAITSLRKCKAHATNPKCLTATYNTNTVETKFPVSATNASWKNTGVLDDRMKVTKMERIITPANPPASCKTPPCRGLTTATFYVTFTRRKIEKNASGNTVEVFQDLPEVAIPIPVVVQSGVANVVGCPRSWNSTELY